ncbi:MAG: tRNA (adenosine(37)-N6)-threonylcarbamoyltransferase complex ATPase subunit type 1 TsaE [Deltaproteobacteria bacterium]|nr:MAG: tRNA (adenosine(37)-N6)-threonylcarbamoyltransferase complex ATPase subunit type 1 TsaE [Deltaproteobacteria bacterium]
MAKSNGEGEGAELVFVTHSPEETRAVARRLAAGLAPGDVVSLEGDLGAGKTEFVRGVVELFGLDGERTVTSPTFTIINVYEGTVPIYHIDLYRLEGTYDELENAGVLECVSDGEGISLVEWGERAILELPSNTIRVILIHLGETEREIRVLFPPGKPAPPEEASSPNAQ